MLEASVRFIILLMHTNCMGMQKKSLAIIAASLAILSLLISGCGIGTGEDTIRSEIEKATSCATNEDCVNLGSKCPLGCEILVNRTEAVRIKPMLDSYQEECEFNCAPCPFGCVRQRCETLCS